MPKAQIHFFDVEDKKWKPLSSTKGTNDASEFYCAEAAGSKLFVAGKDYSGHCVYRYDTEGTEWERLPHSSKVIKNFCIIEDYMYAISPDCNPIPQRYSFSKCQLQTFDIVSVTSKGSYKFYNSGATTLHSKVCVLYGGTFELGYRNYKMLNAVLHRFDPVNNQWEVKVQPASLTLDQVSL